MVGRSASLVFPSSLHRHRWEAYDALREALSRVPLPVATWLKYGRQSFVMKKSINPLVVNTEHGQTSILAHQRSAQQSYFLNPKMLRPLCFISLLSYRLLCSKLTEAGVFKMFHTSCISKGNTLYQTWHFFRKKYQKRLILIPKKPNKRQKRTFLRRAGFPTSYGPKKHCFLTRGWRCHGPVGRSSRRAAGGLWLRLLGWKPCLAAGEPGRDFWSGRFFECPVQYSVLPLSNVVTYKLGVLGSWIADKNSSNTPNHPFW